MPYDPKLHHRQSIRLPDFDYSQQGAYFITIVVKDRCNLLGEIKGEQVQLSDIGHIVVKWWNKIPEHFPNTTCEYFVVMPNHFHGIVEIQDHRSADRNDFKPILGQILGYFKFQSTKEINLLCKTPGASFWQRNYYEHIIRNEDDFRAIYDYIQANPIRWLEDTLYWNEP